MYGKIKFAEELRILGLKNKLIQNASEGKLTVVSLSFQEKEWLEENGFRIEVGYEYNIYW